MAKKPSRAFIAARAALLEILGDGEEHEWQTVLGELKQRGIRLSRAVDNAMDDLGFIITGDPVDSNGQINLYWRLPRHPRPVDVPTWVYAVAFLRDQFARTWVRDRLELELDAEEYQISPSLLEQARKAMGITRETGECDGEPMDCWLWPEPRRAEHA